MNEREAETVIAGNLQRSCRARAEKVPECIRVPEDVRQKRRGSGLKGVGKVPGGMLPGGEETKQAEEAKREDDRAVSFWEFAGSRSKTRGRSRIVPDLYRGKNMADRRG